LESGFAPHIAGQLWECYAEFRTLQENYSRISGCGCGMKGRSAMPVFTPIETNHHTD
jgi:hypothetical protein